MPRNFVPHDKLQPAPGETAGFALPWVEELALQSEALDTDHRALLHRLNDLLFALGCTDLDRITPACAALSSEAEAHFAKEKALMEAVDYPDRAAHIATHEQLLRDIGQFGFALTTGLIPWSPARTIGGLERWFVPHLTYADRRLADFVAARSAVPNAA
jgi:hemerythrin-like metal-binding protein